MSPAYITDERPL